MTAQLGGRCSRWRKKAILSQHVMFSSSSSCGFLCVNLIRPFARRRHSMKCETEHRESKTVKWLQSDKLLASLSLDNNVFS